MNLDFKESMISQWPYYPNNNSCQLKNNLL